MTKTINEMFQQLQKKILKAMKSLENVFEKIAKKVITLNEIVIQNSFFFHQKIIFSKRQNSSFNVFNRFNSSFDCYQRFLINQKHQQKRFQRRERNKSHNKNFESFTSIIAIKEKFFKLFNINYFHFNLSNEHEASDYVIVLNKNMIFRNIYMFV